MAKYNEDIFNAIVNGRHVVFIVYIGYVLKNISRIFLSFSFLDVIVYKIYYIVSYACILYSVCCIVVSCH